MSETMPEPEKKSPKLTIEPASVLHFKGPYTQVVTSYLTLTNPSEKTVCFKVKTTAPRRYCVRPNNGIINAGATTRIAVMLQPFDLENQPDRSKHKFMVQAMYEPECDIDQENLWKMYPDLISDYKLKCMFDTPESATTSDHGAVYSNAETAPELISSPLLDSMQQSSQGEGKTVTEDPRESEEYKRLFTEHAILKAEFLHLNEEVVRRRAHPIPVSGDKTFEGPSTSTVNPVDQLALLSQPQVIAVSLLALFFGLILGISLF